MSILTAERLEEIRRRATESVTIEDPLSEWRQAELDRKSLLDHIATLTPPAEGEVAEAVEALRLKLSPKARSRVEEYAEACEAMKDTRTLASDLRVLLIMESRNERHADLLSRLSAEVARVTAERDLAHMESKRQEMLAKDSDRGRDSEIERLQRNLNLFRDKHKAQMVRADAAERARDEAVAERDAMREALTRLSSHFDHNWGQRDGEEFNRHETICAVEKIARAALAQPEPKGE